MPAPDTRPEASGGPRGLTERLKAMPGRTKLLIVVGVVLLLTIWGPLRGCWQPDVGKDEAIATALAEIDFVPERSDAKLLRQGMTSTAWIVVFTIRDPDGGRDDFLRHTAVTINAQTGEVTDVRVEVP